MAERPYRYFWFSVFLASLIFGGSRFAWVWLVVDDPSAAALVGGVALGLPHLLVGLPAGTYADRLDRRVLVVRASWCGAAVLFAVALLLAAGWMNLGWALGTAAAVGTVVAVVQPSQSAMVPDLVAEELLLTGVALQNFAMQASFFAGSLVSGALIQALGAGWAFAGFGALQLLSGWCALQARPTAHHPVRAGPGPSDAEAPRRLGREMVQGMRYVFGGQPLRSLAVANLVIGLISASTAVLIPAVAESRLDRGAFASSALVSAITPGMLLTTLVLASRSTVRRTGLLFFVGLFSVVPMMLFVALSRSYPLSLAAVLFWGAPVGLFVVLVRQLAQASAEPAMIGRVMGVLHVVSRGSLPVASFGLLLLTRVVSPAAALAVTGVVAAAIALPLLATAELRRA